MKIGILTYHRSHNYGALLQAYALKHVLQKAGFPAVEFVDYFPDYHREIYANIRPKNFRGLGLREKLKYPFYLLFRFYPLYRLREARRRNFRRFIRTYLIPDRKEAGGAAYDVVVYGSDQIWRKQRKPSCPGFNKVYFGAPSIPAGKRIAFSASMGTVDLSAEDKAFLRSAFNNFAAISVREKQLLDEIRSFSDCPVAHTLDPVLLLTPAEWGAVSPRRILPDRYLLFYNLQDNAAAREIAQFISSKLGCQLVELVNEVRTVRHPKGCRPTDGPLEFLSLIQHAEFVVTSSFHGVAFSVLFGKPFYACLQWNAARVVELLSLLGLRDRLIESVAEVDLGAVVDYAAVDLRLRREAGQSVDFLTGAIAL